MLTLALFSAFFVFGNTHKVCYPPYGCFSDEAPYTQALVQLPDSPAVIQTKFLYYTRTNPKVPVYMNPLVSKSPSRVNFHPNKTTLVFVHGYIESRNVWYVKLCIEELLKHEDMNLIFVDWSRGAYFPYHKAAGNTRVVGAEIARMIEVIRIDTGINMQKLRLVGFSLGSHVVGYAGRNLRRKGIILPRITGLDPAAPYFEYQHVDVRLDPTDAEFVDIMHTDSKTLFINGFGTVQEMGHIDFFPNGGYHQVGCGKFDIGVVQYLACSHYRAVRYFMESINNPCPFHAFPCPNYKDYQNKLCTQCPAEGCPKMGYHVEKPKKKLQGMKYYLQTRSEFPYCGYHYKIGFHTGSKFLADLDASITMEITGSNSKVLKIGLPSKYYGKGTTVYEIAVMKEEIGELKKAKIVHNAYIDIWYLVGVTIKPMWTNKEYTACYNRWMNNAQNEVDLYEVPISTCNG